jgi:hypothetical protein
VVTGPGAWEAQRLTTAELPDLPHRGDPRDDLDLAGYGVVKVLEDRLGRTYPGMPWEPKAAFTALADAYRG